MFTMEKALIIDRAMHGYAPKVPESDVEAPEGVDAR